MDVARAAQALAPRVAPSLLKWKEFLKYCALQSSENILSQFFCIKSKEINFKDLRTLTRTNPKLEIRS